MSSLAQAFQNSIALNRLPMPEPFVFSGDPIQFIEWKASFVSLIDRKGISAADKLYYLKKYVGGPVREMLDGIFFRNDNEAYEDAWNKLNQRYGQPFVIQRAFRERLSKWPRIDSKDAEGLRNFSDFLNACQNAVPHVKGLNMLNDCEENQKLTQKLPDWAASRWNRKVTETLNSSQDFPSFQVFTAFLSMEADIVCNPITSFNALHSSEPATEKRNLRDIKGKRASVLSTLTVTDMENKGPIKGGIRPPCMFCWETKHQLHACSEFMTKSLDERRQYVKEKKLCYGCMKSGHSAKDCRHRHSCDICKGKHPTCLHDNNFVKRGKPAPTSSTQSNVNETATALSLSIARAGPSASTSVIVPVWVSSKKNPSVAVTPADAVCALELDFKDVSEDGKTVSQDDILFLNKLEEGIRENSLGHYEMPLPFKERPSLPDNRQLAMVRLSHLKRKLSKDERYKEHYVKFMDEVIKRGDAEEVKEEGKEGEKWYIPHHGVYHSKKPGKLRVVFDSSARYKGTSLNDYLLPGPDLMNSLCPPEISAAPYCTDVRYRENVPSVSCAQG